MLTTDDKPRLNYDNTAVYLTPNNKIETTGCDMFAIESNAATKVDSSEKHLSFKGGDIVLYVIKNQRSSDPNKPDSPDTPPGSPEPDTPPGVPPTLANPDPDDRNDGVPDGGGGVSAKDGYSSYGTH